MLISALKPDLSRQQAIELLRGAPLLSTLRKLRRGNLERVFDLYIPYITFKVIVSTHKDERASIIAIDAVSGRLDPYCFERLPAGNELVRLEPPNLLAPRLSEDEARLVATTHARRQVYLKGFFRAGDLSITAEPIEGPTLHIPYWIGIFKQGEGATIEVVDAVRKRIEGEKLREVVINWLREQ